MFRSSSLCVEGGSSGANTLRQWDCWRYKRRWVTTRPGPALRTTYIHRPWARRVADAAEGDTRFIQVNAGRPRRRPRNRRIVATLCATSTASPKARRRSATLLAPCGTRPATCRRSQACFLTTPRRSSATRQTASVSLQWPAGPLLLRRSIGTTRGWV